MNQTLDLKQFYKLNKKEIKRRICLKTRIVDDNVLDDITSDFFVFVIEHDMLSKFNSSKSNFSTYIDLLIMWSFGWTRHLHPIICTDDPDQVPSKDNTEIYHRINEFTRYLKKHDAEHLTKLLKVLKQRIQGTCKQDAISQLFRQHIKNFKKGENEMDESLKASIDRIQGQYFVDELENLIAKAMGFPEGLFTLISIDPKTKKINVRIGDEKTNWTYNEQQQLRLRVKGRGPK